LNVNNVGGSDINTFPRLTGRNNTEFEPEIKLTQYLKFEFFRRACLEAEGWNIPSEQLWKFTHKSWS
jgi:hypothetical protein